MSPFLFWLQTRTAIATSVLSFCLSLSLTLCASAAAEGLISHSKTANTLLLHSRSKPATVRFDKGDHEVVKLAARALASDLAKVSGKAASLNPAKPRHTTIYIGALNQSKLVNQLVNTLGLNVSGLRGQWESFQIQSIQDPNNNNRPALLIMGSDRRGTAYGVYELAQAMGVSPWHWWADVPPKQAKKLYVNRGITRFGPPSVKFRGIFINDEDWGLHPWASQSFDPELGDIGPKTYEKVFDLLLRLKANTLWPAMHKVSSAFNEIPENKQLADRYGIVMASSHAEPMLRNNVREWPHPKSEFNYATHANKVLAYWEGRLKENAAFENVYSLGMRGVHDSGMQAGNTPQEKSQFLENIIADQRNLLKKYKSQAIETIPQVFTPYKEVLQLYRNGLHVPEDVTLVWPDDNHGYIRRFTSEQERSRSGGGGVYYHISYLGAPMAYLWLNSIPPSLIWEEMHRAYELGAQEYWILNVGDIKPAEIGIEMFMQMAWNINRWQVNNQHQFINAWARREFGHAASEPIAKIMQGYFQLNYQRKPEHLQWWLPHTRSKGSNLSEAEITQRLQAFEQLKQQVLSTKQQLSATAQDSYFQLVEYPVLASAAANRRYFHQEQYGRWFHSELAMAKAHGRLALAADTEIKQLTEKFNTAIAGGKWRGIMNVEPADNLWRSFRQSPEPLPSANLLRAKPIKTLEYKAHGGANAQTAEVYIEAENFSRSKKLNQQTWQVVKQLGRVGGSIGLYPVKHQQKNLKNLEKNSSYVEYDFQLPEAGDYLINFQLLPTFPVSEAIGLRLAYSLSGEQNPPTLLELKRKSKTKAWAQAVLQSKASLNAPLKNMRQGKHTLRVYGIDSGVLLDRIFIYREGNPGSYLGPG